MGSLIDTSPGRRRLVTIPMLVLVWGVAVVATPVVLAIGALIDGGRLAMRRRPIVVRLWLFGLTYATLEIAGLTLLGGVWLAGLGRRPTTVRLTYRVQRWWASRVLGAVLVIFRMRIEVEGATVAGGPVIVLSNHASLIDTLLPAHLFDLHLRYVLKRELLLDPCLDVAGTRLPNHFVDRSAGGRADVEALRALASGLGSGDGVLIYPEGTRFSASKAARRWARTSAARPELVDAEPPTQVLPPQTPGTLALLDGCPDCDIVVLSHAGLAGFARVADILRGDLVGGVIRIRLRRIPRSEVPTGRRKAERWLFDVWRDIDSWLVEKDRPGAGQA